MVFGLQTQPKSWLTGYTFWVNHYLEIVFSKISVVNPPPLKQDSEQIIVREPNVGVAQAKNKFSSCLDVIDRYLSFVVLALGASVISFATFRDGLQEQGFVGVTLNLIGFWCSQKLINKTK